MTKMLIAPIVGAHFRPPAKLILEALPSGASLQLEAEPQNAYDSDAVKVLVDCRQVKLLGGIEIKLAGMGFDLKDILEIEPIRHVGYLPNAKNKDLRDHPEWSPNSQWLEWLELMSLTPEACCKLGFSPEGKALAILQVEGAKP